MNKNFMKKYCHYGDILAVPFFGLMTVYFYNIDHKSTLEYILLLFAILGFIADVLFTYIFLSTGN